MNTPNWFKGRERQSLDELLNSLTVLKDPEDPENREKQELVMSVGPVNGVIHAQYVHDGVYTEKPVGFSYRLGGIEHTFSLSDKYERGPIREGSVVIPLSVIEGADLPLNTNKDSPLEKRVVHPLGVRIDDSVRTLWIYDKKEHEPLILLVDDPDISCLEWLEADLKRTIEKTVEPIQIAQFRHQYTRINALRAGFLAGRDFAVKLRQVLEKGGSLDDVFATVERGIPPQYKFYRSQDEKLVKFAQRAGMFSHPIHMVRGLSSYTGFNGLGQRTNQFIRYALPLTTFGISLALLGFIVTQAIRVNYTEQPEPSRIRGKILSIPQEFLEKELRFLEPYSCLPAQFILSDKVKDHFKGDFDEKSIVFYETLSARGYFPAPYAMRALRALNRGRGYKLDVVERQERRILTYIADPYWSQFLLEEHGIGEASSSKPSRVSLFVMDQDGVIDYFISLKPEDDSCLALKPYQFIYRQWLKGSYQWEDLRFAQMQKRVARELEKIASNPNRELLRPVN